MNTALFLLFALLPYLIIAGTIPEEEDESTPTTVQSTGETAGAAESAEATATGEGGDSKKLEDIMKQFNGDAKEEDDRFFAVPGVAPVAVGVNMPFSPVGYGAPMGGVGMVGAPMGGVGMVGAPMGGVGMVGAPMGGMGMGGMGMGGMGMGAGYGGYGYMSGCTWLANMPGRAVCCRYSCNQLLYCYHY